VVADPGGPPRMQRKVLEFYSKGRVSTKGLMPNAARPDLYYYYYYFLKYLLAAQIGKCNVHFFNKADWLGQVVQTNL
jgi:hypothetical protein